MGTVSRVFSHDNLLLFGTPPLQQQKTPVTKITKVLFQFILFLFGNGLVIIFFDDAAELFAACGAKKIFGVEFAIKANSLTARGAYDLAVIIIVTITAVAAHIYLLVIVGFVNSTNITDGLDGLASSVCLSVAMGIVLLSAIFEWRYTGVIGATLIGATLGFLVFNHYPAKIFMGDTGSLYIGGIIMGCAVAEGELVIFIIMSLLFILEMLSSLWQRVYFKLTHGKRFFKMAPIHHHFQKMGWGEIKIVCVFFIASLIFVAIGVLGKIIC